MKATLARAHGRAEVMSAWASSEFESEHWVVYRDEQRLQLEAYTVKCSSESSESRGILPVKCSSLLLAVSTGAEALGDVKDVYRIKV